MDSKARIASISESTVCSANDTPVDSSGGSESPAQKLAYAAAGVALFVYLLGSIACFFLPEPKGEALPE